MINDNHMYLQLRTKTWQKRVDEYHEEQKKVFKHNNKIAVSLAGRGAEMAYWYRTMLIATSLDAQLDSKLYRLNDRSDTHKYWTPKLNTKAGKEIARRLKEDTLKLPDAEDFVQKFIPEFDTSEIIGMYMIRTNLGAVGDKVFLTLPNSKRNQAVALPSGVKLYTPGQFMVEYEKMEKKDGR